MMMSSFLDPYFFLCIVGGFIIAVIVIFLLKGYGNSRNNAVSEYIRERGWKLVSMNEDPAFVINVKGKSEGFYYIKYKDKEGKLHDCSLHVDFGENEYEVVKDVIIP